MGNQKHDVEFSKMEYHALLNNLMISSMFEEYLRTPKKKSGEYITISMSESIIDSLAGFVAAEANHAKSEEEEEILGSAYESIESTLYSIKRICR